MNGAHKGDEMESKLLLVFISLLVMVFGLNYGWEDRVDDLINQLKDPNPNVRANAAFVLGQIGMVIAK